jgi:thymidylate synthase
MNSLDKQYQTLLQTILDFGVEKKDRTGTGTKSIFGYTIRHKMSEGFPLLTTKKMPFKTIVTELLWFLRGDTNIKFLVDNNCHIWDGDAYKNYINKEHLSLSFNFLTQEKFINKIKTDDEFANTWGQLGPVYGKQWRSWTKPGIKRSKEGIPMGYKIDYIDQIANLIRDLKTNPDSRRLMVNAWNVGELDSMVLPPCHYGFQVYTRELSWEERRDLLTKEQFRDEFGYLSPFTEPIINHYLNSKNIPKRAISLMWNQRSVDTFLGLPFNIASYGLLLEIIAKEVNMVPDELIGNLGDVHLYSNHIEQAKEQIGREYTPEERELMLKNEMSWRKYNKALNELEPFGGGMSEYYDSYKIPKHSREPYPLPKLILDDWYSTQGDISNTPQDISEFLKNINVYHIRIEKYQSHPTIKAPLSN